MQLGDFFFDGVKKLIYEAPTVGFSYTLDGDGYRTYTPDDEPSAPLQLQFSTYELWSRYVDYFQAENWIKKCFQLTGGAWRYQDQFLEDKFSLIDLRLLNDWAYVLADYPHTTFIKGNLFANLATNVIFDMTRITRTGVIPAILYSDAGERSVADDETLRAAAENSVYSSFQGEVTLDPISPYSELGTSVKPNGNTERPISNFPIALDIAHDRGFRRFRLLNDMVIGDGIDVSNFHIVGVSHVSTKVHVDQGALSYRSRFTDIEVSGTLDGGNELNNCVTKIIDGFNGHIHKSALGGKITLGGGVPTKIDNCSMLSAQESPTINCGGSGQNIGINGYEGLITIENLTGSALVGLSFGVSGTVVIDSSCIAGNIMIRGNFHIEDNSGPNCVVDISGKLATSIEVGTINSIDSSVVQQMVTAISEVGYTNDVANNQIVQLDRDGNEIARFNCFSDTGQPTLSNIKKMVLA